MAEDLWLVQGLAWDWIDPALGLEDLGKAILTEAGAILNRESRRLGGRLSRELEFLMASLKICLEMTDIRHLRIVTEAEAHDLLMRRTLEKKMTMREQLRRAFLRRL